MDIRPTPSIQGDQAAVEAPKSLEEMFSRWKEQKKPSRIAASFDKIEDVEEKHINHFKEYEYMWKPMNGGIWGGIWLTDDIDYIHLVLATTPVVEYLLNLKPGPQGKVTIVEEHGPMGPSYKFSHEKTA